MNSYMIRKKETKLGPSNIVSFNDGVENTPINSLISNIKPVQDLHGYDSPWPAGGGVNKLSCPPSFTQTSNGITLTSDGYGKYTLNL